MNGQTRDRWFAILIPALLLLVAYLFFFNRHRDVNRARLQLERARESKVSQQDLDARQMELDAINQDIRRLSDLKSQTQRHWNLLQPTMERSSVERVRTFAKFSQVLWSHELFTLDEALADGGTQLPRSLLDVLNKPGTTTPASRPASDDNDDSPIQTTSRTSNDSRVWKVEFVGRYGQVRSMLKRLADDESSELIPLSISMSEAFPETDWRRWTLLIYF